MEEFIIDLKTKELYLKIAQMYYELDLTQNQIAQKTGINRSTISRLLKKIRDEGIVKIIINYDLTDPSLAKKLQDKFSLKQAIVVSVNENQSSDFKLRTVGQACAKFLDQIVADNDVIGFSWGGSLAETINSLEVSKKRKNIRCVPLLGGPASKLESKYHVNTICYEAAQKFEGQSMMIDFPAIVENAIMRRDILETDYYKKIVNTWKKISLAVFGIGSIKIAQRSTWLAFYGNDTVEKLSSEGVAGDICSRFFDINGNQIDTHLTERTISIPLEKLRDCRYSIGVAESLEKVSGIIGALRGGYMNVLVTTDETAREILNRT
ncbi:MAG: sugar-binding transcriptional regulator [Sporolactobacillus sp.]